MVALTISAPCAVCLELRKVKHPCSRRFWKAVGSNRGRNTGYPELFPWFSLGLLGKFQYSTSTRQQQQSSKPFPSHYHSSIILIFRPVEVLIRKAKLSNYEKEVGNDLQGRMAKTPLNTIIFPVTGRELQSTSITRVRKKNSKWNKNKWFTVYG